MGTEYQILFAPKAGAIAIIKDDKQVDFLSPTEIDKLVEMLREHEYYSTREE